MKTYLDQIVQWHRARAENDKRNFADLSRMTLDLPPTRSLSKALVAEHGVSIIAEVKRKSPSKGQLAPNLSVADQVRSYVQGGAKAISILTDREFFAGSLDDITLARSVTNLPILRKDFTVSELDVLDARLIGADAILLIASALTPDEVRRFSEAAHGVGLEVLLEIHDSDELALLEDSVVEVVGINQRDLATFMVDTSRAIRLSGEIPAGLVKIAESGVSDPDQLRILSSAGFDGALVGEALVRSELPEQLLRAFIAAGKGS
ncbi:MAG: indole-3-glycerol-phosphate synthase [Acidimicrobiaceae bacterium]|nr:indole-3-glycerol-phosphate synthase [Acidimicrobiaceae bacterium]